MTICPLQKNSINFLNYEQNVFFLHFKGIGTIMTYFLVGKDGFAKPLPDLQKAANIEEHEFK